MIKPINFRQEDIPILKRAEELAKIEGKDFSEWAREVLLNWIQSHNRGNPAFTLDSWEASSEFRAFPTLGEDPDKYFSGKGAVEVSEVRARLDVWKLSVTRREMRQVQLVDVNDTVKCPYGCERSILKEFFNAHLWSQHREQAVKDGRLDDTWAN